MGREACRAKESLTAVAISNKIILFYLILAVDFSQIVGLLDVRLEQQHKATIELLEQQQATNEQQQKATIELLEQQQATNQQQQKATNEHLQQLDDRFAGLELQTGKQKKASKVPTPNTPVPLLIGGPFIASTSPQHLKNETQRYCQLFKQNHNAFNSRSSFIATRLHISINANDGSSICHCGYIWKEVRDAYFLFQLMDSNVEKFQSYIQEFGIPSQDPGAKTPPGEI